MKNLCIDFGSTFVKYAVVQSDCTVLSDKLKFPEASLDADNRYEVSIKEIDLLLSEIFRRVSHLQVEQCFIAVQMHGYVLRDTDGTFSDYISWKDKSGDIDAPEIRNIDFEANGTSRKSNLPLIKLLNRGVERGSTFFTLGSYLAWRLTGSNITHKTDGCAAGFFNAQNLKPVDMGLDLHMPVVTHDVIPIGTCQGIRIYTPVGDHQLSFLGSGAGDTAYLLNIGTATQVSTLGSTTQAVPYEQRPYFSEARLHTVSGLTGGEKLFQGYPVADFCEEVMEAIRILPRKEKILVGGGGSEGIFDQLQACFAARGLRCEKVQHNISQEGMRRLCARYDARIGTMLSEVCFPNFPIILKNAGMDFLIIDNEHGAFDYGFMSSILAVSRLQDLPVIVRLPDNHRKDITKLADMGAGGFLLPMTNGVDDILPVVQYAKYEPVGKRGISTNRAHTFYNPPPLLEYMKTANERMRVYAQIETAAGVRNIREILAVEGVDGVFVGPNDLSCDLGCIGNNGPVKAAIAEIAAEAKRQGKTWGIITTSGDLIDFSLAQGVDYLSYGSEINMLKDASKQIRKNIYK